MVRLAQVNLVELELANLVFLFKQVAFHLLKFRLLCLQLSLQLFDLLVVSTICTVEKLTRGNCSDLAGGPALELVNFIAHLGTFLHPKLYLPFTFVELFIEFSNKLRVFLSQIFH